jgi:hypothetical protein
MLADPGPGVGTLGPADRDILRCDAGLLAAALKPGPHRLLLSHQGDYDLPHPATRQASLARVPFPGQNLPECGGVPHSGPFSPRIEDDGLPVVGAFIQGGTGLQASRRSEHSHPVRHSRIPTEFREAAKHSVRCLPSVIPAAHLDAVQAGSRRCHRNEAVRPDDRLASEHDLHRLAAAPKINIGQPDPVAIRVVPHVHDPPDDDALCLHSPRTLPPRGACRRQCRTTFDQYVML